MREYEGINKSYEQQIDLSHVSAFDPKRTPRSYSVESIGLVGCLGLSFGNKAMRRRDFTGLLATIALSPQTVLSQAAQKRPVIASLWLPSKDAPLTVRYLSQFLTGMRELSYVEGRDFEMVYGFADFHAERLPGLAAELVQLDPDVIVVPTTLQAVALKQATDKIPIVVAAFADPVLLGFAENDARPPGNVTGITPYIKGLPAKQLELAREIVPRAMRIGLVDDVTDPKAHPQRKEIEAVGRAMEIRIIPAEVRTSADICPAYEALSASGVEVVVVEESSMLLNSRSQVAEAASAKMLPTVYGYREHVEAGGLISYGVNLDWCFHRTAYYVDKILKGAKPSELPVELPTNLQLLINLKTAKALKLDIPRTLLDRADEVIE
jgi:putative ABC transport system substrate-binding protein